MSWVVEGMHNVGLVAVVVAPWEALYCGHGIMAHVAPARRVRSAGPSGRSCGSCVRVLE